MREGLPRPIDKHSDLRPDQQSVNDADDFVEELARDDFDRRGEKCSGVKGDYPLVMARFEIWVTATALDSVGDDGTFDFDSYEQRRTRFEIRSRTSVGLQGRNLEIHECPSKRGISLLEPGKRDAGCERENRRNRTGQSISTTDSDSQAWC